MEDNSLFGCLLAEINTNSDPNIIYDEENNLNKLLTERVEINNKNITLIENKNSLIKYSVLVENIDEIYGYTSQNNLTIVDNTPEIKLTKKQKEIYDFFSNIELYKITSQNLVIILGSAGTGKTFLIKLLKNKLKKSIVLTATTGKAAMNIGNDVQTIHKTVNLPITKPREKELSGKTLFKMQEKFKNKKYLLIDEFSMLGQFEFFWLDSRLKQIMSNDEIFGGLSVILCGDIFQLPPVKSHPLYDKQYKRFEEQFGFFLYREFNQIFILDKIMRQQGNESDIFVSLLENLRIGNPCVNDWVYLKNNSIYHEDLTLLPTTIRLFATNNYAKLYNLQQISNSSDKLFCSISNDSHPNIKNKNTELFGGLGTCLYLLLNSPYYLTSNLNVKLGLANGTMGMLRDVLFNNVKGKFHPHILIMEFKNINNRTTTNPNLIPIKMQTIFNEFNFKESRTQFPVKSAFALTIHKSQGMTLENVVVDIGAKEFCPRLTYVALSQIKEFENLKLIPFTAERYLQIKNSLQMKIRIEQYERLKELSNNNN